MRWRGPSPSLELFESGCDSQRRVRIPSRQLNRSPQDTTSQLKLIVILSLAPRARGQRHGISRQQQTSNRMSRRIESSKSLLERHRIDLLIRLRYPTRPPIPPVWRPQQSREDDPERAHHQLLLPQSTKRKNPHLPNCRSNRTSGLMICSNVFPFGKSTRK